MDITEVYSDDIIVNSIDTDYPVYVYTFKEGVWSTPLYAETRARALTFTR